MKQQVSFTTGYEVQLLLIEATRLTPESNRIELEHGSGGLMSRDLVVDVIAKELGDVHIGQMEDSQILDVPGDRIAMTTDSFVVDPVFFGGGNIGNIAVCGTVNDLAVSGARPLYLTLALVIEAGYPISELRSILQSVRDVARESGVWIVAGDTKVVRQGEADKIFINTTGVGVLEHDSIRPACSSVRPGDGVIVTGQLADHSIHILSLRHGLGYENRIPSDCAPLNAMIQTVLERFGSRIHFIRDITRGGLATLLNEVLSSVRSTIQIDEARLPIRPETEMAANMLGISPLYLANEGNLCIFAAPEIVGDLVHTLRSHPYGRHASAIGKVLKEGAERVFLRTKDEQLKHVEFLLGAELPRLC